jgi:hypothetical protein
MKTLREAKNSTFGRAGTIPAPGILTAERDENCADERRLLFLAPLVQVAWAHGVVSGRERHLIFKAAREDEIDERSPLNESLHEWLTNQPSRRFFDRCLDRLGKMLREMTVREREERRSQLLARCRSIAQVSDDERFDCGEGISSEERRLLEEIAAKLGIESGARGFG